MDIKKIVECITKKYYSRDPFDIARSMNAIILFAPLVDIRGFYQFFQRNNIIYIDEDLSEADMKMVCAHELGHMVLHKKYNTVFMDTRTHFNTGKYEIEAYKFAVELLIDDVFFLENWQYTTEQMARMLGYQKELIELRLE